MLPEDILKDDVEVLREELEVYEHGFGELSKIAWDTKREIAIRLAQAKNAGFDTETW